MSIKGFNIGGEIHKIDYESLDNKPTLPVLSVGGDELGGVKNGGNVVINEDGTMTAPETEVTDEQISSAVSEHLEANPDLITSVVGFRAYNDSEATIIDGAWINGTSDGLYGTGKGYCISDYVEIPTWAKTVSVILSEALTKHDNATLKVYDETKTKLAAVFLGVGATTGTIDLPDGAKYWRVSTASTETIVQVNYIKDTNGIIPFAEDISANKQAIYDINNPYRSFSRTDMKYPTKSLWDIRNLSIGDTLAAEFTAPVNQAAQYFSHRQRIYAGERIIFNSANPPAATALNSGMVVTDDNFVVLKKISYTDIRYAGYTFTQDGYCYLSYGVTDETQPLFEIRKTLDFYEMGAAIDNAKKEIPSVVNEQLTKVPVSLLTEEYLLDAVSSVICIGDSVTEGVTTGASGIQRSLSYPSRLTKRTGWTIENAGVAGVTALGWWQNQFSKYDYTKYQLALIELGYNNGLTDTLDVDCVGDDYAAYADTNTGGYCKIIEGALAQNPNLYIVLIISPGFGVNVANVVIKIAEKYSLPVIDLRDTTYIKLQENKYHGALSGGNMDYTHMNAIGYIAKAEFIRTELVKIFAENISTINALAIANTNN